MERSALCGSTQSERRSKDHVDREAVRWSTNRCSEWNQLEHDIGREVRGDALAPLFASGEIFTFGANF
jgi:hypothetical protein